MPDDDYHVEPVRGLPQSLPEGEELLWQGAPSTWALARDALLIRWVAAYFAALVLWRVIARAPEDGWLAAAGGTMPLVLFGLLACGLILAVAWAQARATVYTITNHRVAMRIGVALTLTLNLPFNQIASADLDLRRDGTGTIALIPQGGRRLGYLVLWPHMRPWRMAHPQPALRCIPNAAAVAKLLAGQVRAGGGTQDIAPATAVAAE